MKQSIQKAVFAAFVLAAGSTALAFPVVYVDASRPDDSGAGDTLATAKKTINAGIAAVNAGGTVIVSAGTYDNVLITKAVTLEGPNAGVSPNNPDGTATMRNTEAIIRSATNDTTANDDYTENCVGTSSAVAVTIDGFTLDAYNSSLAGGVAGVGGSTVGANTALYLQGSATVTNNIIMNASQRGVVVLANTNTVTDNRIVNIGVPVITGFGFGIQIAGAATFCTCSENYIESTRAGVQLQGQNSGTGGPAIVQDNIITNTESHGIFLNTMSTSAKNWSFIGNKISGQGPAIGVAGFAIISQSDGATRREHVFANNEITDFYSGFTFVNNNVQNLRITGGSISDVSYGVTFANRNGYSGWIDYSSSPTGFGGRDGAGGPAFFNSSIANATLAAGLTGEIKVPDVGDSASGAAVFTTSFAGKIALLSNTPTVDAGLAAQRAQAAGAIGVIIARDNSSLPPTRLSSVSVPSVDIPTASIGLDDATAIRAQLATRTVSATLNNREFRTNNYGTNAPNVAAVDSAAALINVKIENTLIAGFGVFDIPNSIGSGSATRDVTGIIEGGSSIKSSTVGADLVGEKATIDLRSARFEDNGIGVRAENSTVLADGVIFSDNTIAGTSLTGPFVVADIRSSDFFGAAQTTDVTVADNPTGVIIFNSNFDADDTGVENLVPGSGDVDARGNFWGAANGPDDAAGVINGDGAAITLGVNAGDFLTAGEVIADSDGDGLSDSTEDANRNGIVDSGETNPANPDTDSDGLLDGIEVALGTDPLSNLSPGSFTDGDGDGLPFGTDPDDTKVDTDLDGIKDGYEVIRGSNPANQFDFPPFGDANSDAVVNDTDAIILLEAFLGIRDFRTVTRNEADINQDGSIDNIDAVLLYQYVIDNVAYIPFP